MLPAAAPMIVPATPRVDNSTAEDTAARAPPIVCAQLISKRFGSSGASVLPLIAAPVCRSRLPGRDPALTAGALTKLPGERVAKLRPVWLRAARSGPVMSASGSDPVDGAVLDRLRHVVAAVELLVRHVVPGALKSRHQAPAAALDRQHLVLGAV